MRVLVAISILAFLALLWASVAIFRHIRRARRRRRRFLESSLNTPPLPAALLAPRSAPPIVPEIAFDDPEAPVTEVSFTDPEAPEPDPVSAPPRTFQPFVRQSDARQIEGRQTEARAQADPSPVHYATPAAEPKTPAAPAPAITDEFQDTLPPQQSTPPVPRDKSLSPLPAWPHFGFTPARASGPTSEPIPYAAPPPTESSASVAPARVPLEIQPPAPAVKPLYPSAKPSISEAPPPLPPPISHRSGQHPIVRSDWAYFNKDMGDLSDPAPAGSRPRIRTKIPD